MLEQTTARPGETGSVTTNLANAEGVAPADGSGSSPKVTPYDFFFRDLQDDPDNLLEESPETVAALKSLGETMRDPGEGIPDSDIPSAYTYFGQFVTHEISFEDVSRHLVNIAGPDIKPLPPQQISKLVNTRSPNLDLDSVYGAGSVREHDWMRIGRVSHSKNGRPKHKDDYNDLPRSERSPIKEEDRAAQIGDPRNDENLIISQMHLAFLRAHNRRINEGHKFVETTKLLRQHYQHIVLEDFLTRVVNPAIVKSSKYEKNRFFSPPDDRFFIPLEFSVAAFRFGHSMVRRGYNDFNVKKGNVGLEQLFAFTRFSGQLGFEGEDGNPNTIPEDWIIEWEHFVGTGPEDNHARRIDTTLVEPLFHLSPGIGAALPFERSLAIRNLLRGYVLRLPTGQAVAKRMGIPPLTYSEIESVAQKVSDAQLAAVKASQFTTRTPLWYYILAEAAHFRALDGTDHLGPVGSTLVAEVILEILRRSDDSILGPPFTPDNPWVPTLPGSIPGEFNLSDFLRFAGVL